MVALTLLFAAGSIMSALALLTLLTPGGALEAMWRVNPRAHEQLQSTGPWAWVLMAVVSLCCFVATVGLWTGRRFGYVLGVALLAISLIGALANAVVGGERRAWLGVPIAGILLLALIRPKARTFFD